MIRKPAVAGSFYPSEREALTEGIRSCFLGPLGPGILPPSKETSVALSAIVCPHAGYQYSGQVAAHSYLHASCLPHPEVMAVVAPNHYGVGGPLSSFGEGFWETPLGRVPVDSVATAEFISASGAADDPEAHAMEHSLEVQLPFLQFLYGNGVPVLPVMMLNQDEDSAAVVGVALAKVLKSRKSVLVASSDLTHYEPASDASPKDSALLGAVADLDVGRFYSTLEDLSVTACGYGPVAAVMTAARQLGFSKGEVLKYADSGDVTGDKSSVVGYGSVRFVK